MEANEQQRFDTLYAQHLRTLKLRGYSASTIEAYARAVRRLTEYFDCVPNQLSIEQLEIYFAELVDSHSWATVRVDRSGNAPALVECSAKERAIFLNGLINDRRGKREGPQIATRNSSSVTKFCQKAGELCEGG